MCYFVLQILPWNIFLNTTTVVWNRAVDSWTDDFLPNDDLRVYCNRRKQTLTVRKCMTSYITLVPSTWRQSNGTPRLLWARVHDTAVSYQVRDVRWVCSAVVVSVTADRATQQLCVTACDGVAPRLKMSPARVRVSTATFLQCLAAILFSFYPLHGQSSDRVEGCSRPVADAAVASIASCRVRPSSQNIINFARCTIESVGVAVLTSACWAEVVGSCSGLISDTWQVHCRLSVPSTHRSW